VAKKYSCKSNASQNRSYFQALIGEKLMEWASTLSNVARNLVIENAQKKDANLKFSASHLRVTQRYKT